MFGNVVPRYSLRSSLSGKRKAARQLPGATASPDRQDADLIKRQRPRTTCDANVHKHRQPPACDS